MNTFSFQKMALTLMLLAATFCAVAQDKITLTWEVEAGSLTKEFTIDATAGKTFTVDWGNGTTTETSEGYSQIVSHTYSTAGTYNVIIAGNTTDYEFHVFDFKCPRSQVSALYVSQCTELKHLTCSENSLIALSVSQNTELTWLDCYKNSLTALDVSQNTELAYFDCSDNPLTELDVSQNTELIILYCSKNSLTELDVSQNTKLKYLGCTQNSLTALDVSQNTELIRFYCTQNFLTALDVSQNTKLEGLFCSGNRLPLSNLYALSEEQVPDTYLGGQDLRPMTVKIGIEQFEEESFFGGEYTRYDITPDDGYTIIMDGKLTFNKLGVYNVIMINDAIQHYASVHVTITVNETGIGIDELQVTSYELRVYPNPTNGELHIGFATSDNPISDIVIYDIYGRMLQTISRKSEIEKSEIKIDVSHLPSGIYFLKAGNRMAKFVKQ